MKRLAVASVCIFVPCGCTTASSGATDQAPAPEPTTLPWVCGQEYENYAWGYQRRGVVLAGDGSIWRYDVKGSPATPPNSWHPKDMNALTEAELRVRYNGAIDTGKRVPIDDIAQHLPLVREAATTPPTEGRNAAADMGEKTLYCLVRNVPYGTYRQVLIDQKGDFDRTNPSSAAKALAAWLDGVFKATSN